MAQANKLTGITNHLLLLL